MPANTRFLVFSLCHAIVPVGGHAGALDADAITRLDSLQANAGLAGALVYQGTVFAQKAVPGSPLFSYERRVLDTPDGLTAAHVTRAPQGQVLIVEAARVTPAYGLQRFDAVNRQIGYSGSVVVSNDGKQLTFELLENGKRSTASEAVRDPVLAGSSLHGFILAHWDALASGKDLPVRMIVMAKKETYGFTIRQSAQRDGRTGFSVTPSSLLVRLAVAPLRVEFDSNTRRLLRYEGRVPPRQNVGGKLEDLDARVEYTMVMANYR